MRTDSPPAYEKYATTHAITQELRKKLPWLFQPGFKVGDGEGYDGQEFGSRAGPYEAKTVYNVLHEVAHAVEMTLLPAKTWKRRVLQPSFGMRIKTFQTIAGRDFHEPVTMQPTERECRVGGIQLRLLQAAGYDTSSFEKDYVLTLRFMADWYQEGSCPMGERITPENKSWMQARSKLVRAAYKQFPLEDIQQRWKGVTSHLHRHLEPEQLAA